MTVLLLAAQKGDDNMNIVTVIAVLALAAVIFFAVRYIVREKKKGSKCVGCPYAGECCKYADLAELVDSKDCCK